MGKIAFILKWTSLSFFNIFTKFSFSLHYLSLYFYFIVFYTFNSFLWNFSLISLFWNIYFFSWLIELFCFVLIPAYYIEIQEFILH